MPAVRLAPGFDSAAPERGPRAFASVAGEGLPELVRRRLVGSACAGTSAGHMSRDAIAIEGREKPEHKE